uniref:Uncharacterized protein n=1 Tax=Glossina palpalis gambiensis TaxID=67801 RepID=A0A1B0BH27_9MUSC
MLGVRRFNQHQLHIDFQALLPKFLLYLLPKQSYEHKQGQAENISTACLNILELLIQSREETHMDIFKAITPG